MNELHNRRAFLRAAMAAGAAWAAADLVQVEEALVWASGQASAGGRPTLSAFTSAQATAMDALASRILPAVDGRPGAREAGAVYFIDRALSTFNARQKRLYVNGLADLNRRAARRRKDAAGFAGLTAPEQDEVVREIEKTPFFEAARFDTIVGTFALPSWGGNRDHLGWHLLGMTHQPRFQAPFGYYDTDVNRKG